MSEWVVAVAAVIRHEGRVLAMRRSARKDAGAGIWETLSGRVEPGESPLEAVVRETYEESGLRPVFDPAPVAAYSAFRNENPMIVIVYAGFSANDEVCLTDEHDEYRWVTPAEFGGLTTLPRLGEVVI